MKQYFILLVIASLMLSSCAGLRVEKRRYTSGWYLNSVSLGVRVEGNGERETVLRKSADLERETVRGKSSVSLGVSVEGKGERETVRRKSEDGERETERGKSADAGTETVRRTMSVSVAEKGERENSPPRRRERGKVETVLIGNVGKQDPQHFSNIARMKECVCTPIKSEQKSSASKPVDDERKKKNTFQILLAASLLALLGAIMIVTAGLSPVLFLALAVTGVVLLVVAILNRPKRATQINTEPISEPIDPNYKKGSNKAIDKTAKTFVLVVGGLILGFFLFAAILIYTILLQFV